jgi:uncharacterized protein (DUF4415 family)
MAHVINLNKFRKRKAKLEQEKNAETNRRLHGRSKAERAREELQKKQLTVRVDQAFLEKSKEDESAASDDGTTTPERE